MIKATYLLGAMVCMSYTKFSLYAQQFLGDPLNTKFAGLQN